MCAVWLATGVGNAPLYENLSTLATTCLAHPQPLACFGGTRDFIASWSSLELLVSWPLLLLLTGEVSE
jgi:hypothetical protein